jgi:hypothetical protein
MAQRALRLYRITELAYSIKIIFFCFSLRNYNRGKLLAKEAVRLNETKGI